MSGRKPGRAPPFTTAPVRMTPRRARPSVVSDPGLKRGPGRTPPTPPHPTRPSPSRLRRKCRCDTHLVCPCRRFGDEMKRGFDAMAGGRRRRRRRRRSRRKRSSKDERLSDIYRVMYIILYHVISSHVISYV